jgi:GH43 family beta-xylosidase
MLEREVFDNRDLKQLYRKEDGHYFFYNNVGLYEPIDTETAHTAKNTTAGYRRFLTDS